MILLFALACTSDLAKTEAFLDTRPTYERPLRETGFQGVAGVGSLSAEACRACHPQHYEDWRSSVHSQAWIDPQFQAEIGKSGNRWLCLNCHTPLLVQHDRWPAGLVDGDVEKPVLVDNARFDEALRDEGITCTACHLRDGVLHGPGHPGAESAPHPVQADPAFRGPDLCLSCHQAEATYPGKTFICTFQTGDEWRAGPHDDEGQTCLSCHMPGRRHWWRGAGIPKFPGRYPPEQANVPGLGLAAAFEGDELVVTMTNASAGHRLPTGDPERWVQVDATFEPSGERWQHRIAQVWEWTAPPRKVSDNRLAPRETRVERVPVPPGTTSVVVEASSHRISEANAAYHHLDGYPRSVDTHRIELQNE